MNHHDHDHKHSHDHHEHTHNHEKKELSINEKLTSLFQHWIDHNKSHQESYISWSKKAQEKDLQNVVACLEQVSNLTDEINVKLKETLDELT
jgi:hypothetical protein